MLKLTFFLWAVLAIGCDKSKCPKTPTIYSRIFYEEIGCTEVNDSDDCCTVRFDCPERPTDGKCHFNGKSYNFQEKLPDDDQPLCLHSCICLKNNGEFLLKCQDVECPEYFRPEINRTIVKEHGKCCGTFVYDEERAELAKTKCYVEGKEYFKGELMVNDCHACICGENFDNRTISDSHDCKKIQCNVDVHHTSSINNGCIPVFHKDSICCPFYWRCPDPTDEIVSTKQSVEQASDSKLTCQFGKLKLNVGDELNNIKEGVTCVCDVPPMPHCVSDHYY